MTDVVVRKSLTEFKGRVEYTMHYRNSTMCGHDPSEPHWETESFSDLKGFLQLVSSEAIEQMKHVHAADRVEITHIYLDVKNDQGDTATIWLGENMQAYAGSKVSSDDLDSRMQLCVEELERQIDGLKSTISRYRA